MTTRTKYLLVTLAVVTAFAAGRWTNGVSKTSDKIDTTTKTKETNHRVTVITKDPSGKETTTITEDIVIKEKEKKNEVKTVTVAPKHSSLNISALVGTSIHTLQPVYGASISKEILGPVTIGAFGLTNGTAGVSVGLNF